jgi:glycosyltransferase involved in cell wall biosynthesis
MRPTERGALAQLSPQPAPTAAARVCIVSSEINGPSRNGGIGTTYATLAEKLTRAGHDVTLLYLLGSLTERQPATAWVEDFGRRGIRFVPLDPGEVPLRGSRSLQVSYLAYRWLADQEAAGNRFDVIHFHEWLGFGYYSLLARRQGLALQGSTICVGLHSPTLWLVEASQGAIDDVDLLECDALERRCVELANAVHSPSRYLLDWVRAQGWDVEGRAWVNPNPVPLCSEVRAPEAGVSSELVFFGRLEVRKGLVLFCDALDRLDIRDLPARFRVSFLGKSGPVNGVDAVTYLRRRAARWCFPMDILTDHDHGEALAHLRRPGRLAVMPSLLENCPLTVIECLALGVPFLASAVGGIPELVSEESRLDVLFSPSPEALARRLRQALHEGVRPARPAIDAGACDAAWDQWHRRQRRQNASNEFVGDPHRARGEYVLLTGPEATPMPGAVSRMAAVAERTGADMVTSLEDIRDGANTVPRFRRLWAGLDSRIGIVRNCFGGACVLVRREALARLERAGGITLPSAHCWEFLARAVLTGLRLEVIPEALFATPIELEDLPPDLSACLRPYLEEVPESYRELLKLAQGQALRVQWLREELARQPAGKPRRYWLADLLHAALVNIPLVGSLLRWLRRQLLRP